MSCYSTSGSHKEHVSSDFVVPVSHGHINEHTPLGHSDTHDHFIQPVPGYETEYEHAYCHDDSDIYKIDTIRVKSSCRYNDLKTTIKKMIDTKFEVEKATTLLNKLNQSEKEGFRQMKELTDLYDHVHHMSDW